MKCRKEKRKAYEEANKEKQEDLKGEIRRLRKQVQQLRKANAKLLGRDIELQDLLEDIQLESDMAVKEKRCPKCNGKDVKIIEKLMNNKDYFFCKNSNCNARGPIK